jgi:hypothetical protein
MSHEGRMVAADALMTENRQLREALEGAAINERRWRARNGRLRKAVNWLRGACHTPDESEGHWGTVDECDVWECQRARDILAEASDEWVDAKTFFKEMEAEDE